MANLNTQEWYTEETFVVRINYYIAVCIRHVFNFL